MTSSKYPTKNYTAIFCAAFLLAAVPHTARADNDKSDRGRGHGYEHENESYDNNHGIFWSNSSQDNRHARIEERDRIVIRDYMNKHHKKHCPPGLAKKHNGCLPPGLAQHYRVGEVLPQESILETLSRTLLGQLNPAPKGHRYVRVENDVYLMNNSTRQIIDAVASSLGGNN